MISINIMLSELMTSEEKSEFIKKGLQTVAKKPGNNAITFSKKKEKKGEAVTVADTEEVTDFNNALIESILLPIGNKGVFFEQNEILCANYTPTDQTCNAGCPNVGVDKGTRCPYQPIDSQPKCPCYKRK